MSTPDLRQRFDRAADRLPDDGGDVDAVVARGRARARRRRAAGVAAGAVAVVLVATLAPRLLDGDRSIAVDPVDEAPSPTPSPTPTTSDPAPAEDGLTWDHSRYGTDGVVRHPGPGDEPARTSTQPVRHAVGTPGGAVVTQEELGAAIVHLDEDGTRRELVPTARGQHLLTVDDGTVWFTRRTEPGEGEEDEELLLSVPLADDPQPVEHGTSAPMESFTDALAVGPGDTFAWLSCHLQCRVLAGELDAIVGDGDRTELVADPAWFSALAYAPDGDRLAVVEGPDPVIGGTTDVVVLDASDGRELRRIELDVALELGETTVSFTPDGRDLVVGDAGQALHITGLDAEAPSVTTLDGDAGVTLHPGADAAD